MPEAEWPFFEPFLAALRQPNGCKAVNYRPVLDGVFLIARTGVLGAICPKSLASGGLCTASSGAGPWQVSGKQSWKL